jgi:hypothetical protein
MLLPVANPQVGDPFHLVAHDQTSLPQPVDILGDATRSVEVLKRPDLSFDEAAVVFSSTPVVNVRPQSDERQFRRVR